MKKTSKQKYLHILFQASLFIKALDAILEIYASIFILLATHTFINKVAFHLTRRELAEDPTSFIANAIIHAAAVFPLGVRTFAFAYLLFHGIIKLAIVFVLLKKKLWAYPVSMAILSLFVGYELYRFVYTHSILLLVLALFDMIVVWLVLKEYDHLKIK